MKEIQVLISHAHDETKLAKAWKDLIETTSSGAIRVWFSSDSNPSGGMELGKEWRDKLYERLGSCDFVLAIQTPASSGRPWIIWECAVANGIDKERGIIPVVYSMAFGDLASPLSSYQSYEGSEETQVQQVCARLAEAGGLKPPAHIYEQPIKTYLDVVELNQPRKAVRVEQLEMWRGRFEELIVSGRASEILGQRQLMYTSLGKSFTPKEPSTHELLSRVLIDQG